MIHSQSRRVGGISLSWFLFSSLLLHFLMVAFLYFYRDTKPKGFPIATTVELVSEDRIAKTTENPAPPAVPVKPQPRPQIHHLERHHVKVVKHAVIPIRKKIVRKTVQPKKPPVKVKNKVVPKRKLLAKNSKPIRKKRLHETPKTKPVATNALAKANPVRNPNSMPVKMDIEGQTFPTYLEHILISRIKSNWFPPPGTKGLKATIRFVLKKEGNLDGQPTIESGSGNALFDDAARMAVLRSIPFPPFPPGYKKEKEVVTVTLEATPHGGVFDGQ